MATYSSILAWKIPWNEESGKLQSRGGHKRAGHDLVTKQQQQICIYRNLRCQNIKNTENST